MVRDYSMTGVFSDYEARVKDHARNTSPFAQGIALIDGEYVPIADARIPITDQGFLHSDLTYDVPAVWDGRFFRLDDHIDRFEKSCEKLRLKVPMEREVMRNHLIEMVAKTGLRDAYVEMLSTRGLEFIRRYELYENTIYLYVIPYVWIMPPELQMVGASAAVTRTVRRIPPGAIDPTVKNFQWGDFIRGFLEAFDRGIQYPLLPDGDGNITEGGGYNLFVVKDGALRTPIRGVLEGITRRTVLELAEAGGMRAEIDFVKVDELYNADELFVCSTAGGVMPLATLDGEKIGDGKVGPITRRIWEDYWAAHYDPKYSFAVEYP